MQSIPGGSRPGKTAPRLIADLLDYDARYRASRPANHDSILAAAAPRFLGEEIARTGPLDCHHSLMRKESQTSRPPPGYSIEGADTWRSGSYCINCKQHFTVIADYRDSKQPCHLLDDENPLHHFITTHSETRTLKDDLTDDDDKNDNIVEKYNFECSAELCNLRVEINIGRSRLLPRHFSTLLDTAKVVARGQKQIDEDPVRYAGATPVRPLQALSYLWTYLKNAKASSEILQLPKRIAQRNKKFLLAFGDDSVEMLQYLGFELIEEVTETADGQNEAAYFWQPPIINMQNANFYEDILCEIESKMRDRPAAEHQAEKMAIRMNPQPAIPDIELALGCYDRMRRSRNVDLTIPEHPYYASLGAVGDLTDEHLGWAYERQCISDPVNRPYYFDCLKDLAAGRESTELDTKVAIAESAGEVGIQDIERAYRYFGIDPNFNEGDSHIAGLYKSRIASAPRQKEEAREKLMILAKARSSVLLDELVNDKTLTYDEALRFLSVTPDTDADSIVAQATVQALDGDKAKVALALRAIATQRKDYAIHVKISELEETSLSLPNIEEAYKRLQIPMRSVPDSTVLTYYSSLSSGAAAGSKDSFIQALRAIAHDRQSDFLLRKLEDPNAEVTPELLQSPDQPIGLNNIGNTCYLNSLLQYFYTIQPLRDVALNLDTYRLPMTEDAISNRRAGGRQNTRKEIEKGQRFTEELSTLFENLKTAPTRAIRPTVELADLSFFNEGVEATIRRASVASPSGPPKIVFGPEGPPLAEKIAVMQNTIHEDVEMEDRPTEKVSETASNASETTLVDMDSPSTLPAAENDTDLENVKDQTVASESKQDEDATMGNNRQDAGLLTPPPDKPPPVPPRNKNGLSISTSKSDKVVPENERWQLGTQQDVDEVIRNTTWRMMCAIKPTATDPISGEQSDKIRDTFYGDTATYLVKSSKLERKVESWSSLLVYASEKKAIDIYEAIDLTLDKQDVEVDKGLVPQFSSITKLPPILQIQINRTVYDKVQKRSVKVKGAVNFPETIFLDRYMDSSDLESPLMQRRKEGWRMKAELQALESRVEALQNGTSSSGNDATLNKEASTSLNVAESLNNTKDLITSLQEAGITDIDIPEDLSTLIDERISEIGVELEETKERVEVLRRKLAEQFTDMRKYEYKLQAVFIHRGSAGAGHYWIYIYDFKNDIWREYNDERVDIVNNRKRIFDSQFEEGATPYYLVYVRASDREDLVEPVCRAPRAAEEVEQKDAEMPDLEEWTDVNDNDVDEGIAMDDSDDVAHVEHVRPKPLRAKLPTNQWEEELEANETTTGADAPVKHMW